MHRQTQTVASFFSLISVVVVGCRAHGVIIFFLYSFQFRYVLNVMDFQTIHIYYIRNAFTLLAFRIDYTKNSNQSIETRVKALLLCFFGNDTQNSILIYSLK